MYPLLPVLLACYRQASAANPFSKEAPGGVKVGKFVAKFTEEQFNYTLRKADRKDLLVEFFSPGCSSCQQFAPIYAQAGELVKQRGIPVKVSAIDADKYSDLANRYRIDHIPTVLFFPKGKTKPIKYGDTSASAGTLADWLEAMARPTVGILSSASDIPAVEAGFGRNSTPVVVMRAAKIADGFQQFAEVKKISARWYFLEEENEDDPNAGKVEIHHWKEPAKVFNWTDLDADELDEVGLEFEEFWKQYQYPLFTPVLSPNRFVDEMQKSKASAEGVGIIWVVLNTAAPETEACSANLDPGADGQCSAQVSSGLAAGTLEALEQAAEPWRKMMMKVARTASMPLTEEEKKNKSKRQPYRVVYIDANRWPLWIENNLYVWDFPKVIVQRGPRGSRYFFGGNDGSGMPKNTQELLDFVNRLAIGGRLEPRSKSERPPTALEASARSWVRLVADTLEDSLRSVPATILYAYKQGRQQDLISDEEDAVVSDELEVLDDIAEWMRKNCEVPPQVAAIDLRRNDIPLSLYAKVDLSPISAPMVVFIPNDGNKSENAYWGVEPVKYHSITEDPTLEAEHTKIQQMGAELQRAVEQLQAAQDKDKDEAKRLQEQVERIAEELKRMNDKVTEKQDKPIQDLKIGHKTANLLVTEVPHITRWALQESRKINGLRVPADANWTGLVGLGGGAGVDVFTKESLKAKIAGKASGMVEFYSPSCSACQRFATVYESAARGAKRMRLRWRRDGYPVAEGQGLAGHPTELFFAKIDSTDDSSLMAEFQVSSYPTLFFMHDGEMQRYTGGRKKEEMLQFLDTELRTSYTNVSGLSEAMQLSEKSQQAGLLYEGPLDDNLDAALEGFESWKQRIRMYAHEDGRAAEEAELTFFRNSRKSDMTKFTESAAYRDSGSFKADAVEVWLSELTVRSEEPPKVQDGPVRIVVGSTFREQVFNAGRPVMIEIYASWCGHCKKLEPHYKKFAQKMIDDGRDLTVLKMDGTANAVPFAGFEWTGFPTIFFKQPDKADAEKVMARTYDALVAFVKKKKIGYSKGGAAFQPTATDLLDQFKSEDIPKQQTWPVKTAVFKNMLTDVINDKRSSVMMVFAPWCNYCKAAMPDYEKFAESAHGKNLAIDFWKLNGERNELPMTGFGVRGYPTIFFIKAGEKEPAEVFGPGSNAVTELNEYVKAKYKTASF